MLGLENKRAGPEGSVQGRLIAVEKARDLRIIKSEVYESLVAEDQTP
jgi:hypothetical protein